MIAWRLNRVKFVSGLLLSQHMALQVSSGRKSVPVMVFIAAGTLLPVDSGSVSLARRNLRLIPGVR